MEKSEKAYELGFNFQKKRRDNGTSTGVAVLGNPVQSVTWLTGQLAEFGVMLKAGEIILHDSLMSAVDVKLGGSIVAEFDRIGSATVYFK